MEGILFWINREAETTNLGSFKMGEKRKSVIVTVKTACVYTSYTYTLHGP